MKQLFRICMAAWFWATALGNLMAQGDSIHTRYSNLPTIYIETFGKVAMYATGPTPQPVTVRIGKFVK